MDSVVQAAELERLQKENKRLKHSIDLLEQKVEALGDDNRYFAGQALGHSPTEKEALEYYCDPENDGAAGHRRRVQDRAQERESVATIAA